MTIQTVLGFDYGERRIGIATGQTITCTATPLVTLNAIHQKPDWAGIEKLIQEWQPDALIVGIPRHRDGSASDITEKAERFCRQLEGRFRLPIYTVDERLSSAEAEEHLKQNRKIGQHNKHEIDKMAAAIIVQRWLEQNP
ncbi:MAG: Holliday junction resolvase RuvX [Gammaproteobacteria bacterium]|nr:MAG: Holliday junction resolvase RuvX [Gammaproteobacteria bacterium]